MRSSEFKRIKGFATGRLLSMIAIFHPIKRSHTPFSNLAGTGKEGKTGYD